MMVASTSDIPRSLFQLRITFSSATLKRNPGATVELPSKLLTVHDFGESRRVAATKFEGRRDRRATLFAALGLPAEAGSHRTRIVVASAFRRTIAGTCVPPCTM